MNDPTPFLNEFELRLWSADPRKGWSSMHHELHRMKCKEPNVSDELDVNDETLSAQCNSDPVRQRQARHHLICATDLRRFNLIRKNSENLMLRITRYIEEHPIFRASVTLSVPNDPWPPFVIQVWPKDKLKPHLPIKPSQLHYAVDYWSSVVKWKLPDSIASETWQSGWIGWDRDPVITSSDGSKYRLSAYMADLASAQEKRTLESAFKFTDVKPNDILHALKCIDFEIERRANQTRADRLMSEVNFGDFPEDIQYMVCQEVVRNTLPTIHPFNGKSNGCRTAVSLMRANKLLHNICETIFYTSKTFAFQSPETLDRFLDPVRGVSSRLIHRIKMVELQFPDHVYFKFFKSGIGLEFQKHTDIRLGLGNIMITGSCATPAERLSRLLCPTSSSRDPLELTVRFNRCTVHAKFCPYRAPNKKWIAKVATSMFEVHSWLHLRFKQSNGTVGFLEDPEMEDFVARIDQITWEELSKILSVHRSFQFD